MELEAEGLAHWPGEEDPTAFWQGLVTAPYLASYGTLPIKAVLAQLLAVHGNASVITGAIHFVPYGA